MLQMVLCGIDMGKNDTIGETPMLKNRGHFKFSFTWHFTPNIGKQPNGSLPKTFCKSNQENQYVTWWGLKMTSVATSLKIHTSLTDWRKIWNGSSPSPSQWHSHGSGIGRCINIQHSRAKVSDEQKNFIKFFPALPPKILQLLGATPTTGPR